MFKGEQPMKTLLIFIFVLLATFIGCSKTYESFPEGGITQDQPWESHVDAVE
jgi:hypothetical protein